MSKTKLIPASKEDPSLPADQAGAIPTLVITERELILVGDSPLICHQWDTKAKEMMLAKQQKKATKGKAIRDPEAEFKSSLYIHPDGGYGFPTTAFKKAAVDAATFVDSKKTDTRGSFHVKGELIRIEGEPTRREDMVRIGMGTSDLRYRGEFKVWKARLPILFNPRVISWEQIENLFSNAGFSIGVGEWRPQKNGQFGRFHVERQEVAQV